MQCLGVLVIVLLLALTGVGCSSGSSNSTEGPNVVIVYGDDVGYGDLGSYGATQISTPHLDSLAEQGVRFTDAYATSSTCTPRRYSLLNGRYRFRKEGGPPGKCSAPYRHLPHHHCVRV